MKRKLKNRKNRIICLILVLELTACGLAGARIYDAESAKIQKQEALRNSRAISLHLASAAVSHKIVLDAKQTAIGDSKKWKGPVLSKSRGSIIGPSGKETYYNLNMDGVVRIMRSMGNEDEYWVREDGCKMLGDYIMVAANLDLRPRGSLVDTSLGKGIVCDTGGFAARNPKQLDIAVTW